MLLRVPSFCVSTAVPRTWLRKTRRFGNRFQNRMHETIVLHGRENVKHGFGWRVSHLRDKDQDDDVYPFMI